MYIIHGYPSRVRAAGYPIILTILGSWVRRLTIVGFLDSKTKGK